MVSRGGGLFPIGVMARGSPVEFNDVLVLRRVRNLRQLEALGVVGYLGRNVGNREEN